MSWDIVLLRLGVAAAIGAAIGFNREMHQKSAGFRTIAIVCVGTALAMLLAVMDTDHAGPSRVMQGVLTGVGFLGGEVIVHHARLDTVEGLTTAAAIWTAAGLGAACGMGYWAAALIGTALVLALLTIGGRVERAINIRSH